ncbi:MAG: DNA ligase [Gammaproteobacteria bacterium]|nr:DNA ligase [Gammaproteobacteria bacterium]
MRCLILSLWIILVSHQVNSQSLTNVAAPQIQLATKYRNNIEIKDYFISEKLDGVRAYWDGHRLISRQGNVFVAPSWFVNNFPNQPLDGELWIARRQFEKVSGIVRQRRLNNSNWRQVKFMVFDLPQSSAIFSKRLNKINKLIKQADSPYLMMIKQIRLSNESQLLQQLDQVIVQGGEGLMLHRATSLYQAKRSNDLMKLKRFDDAEATVLAHFAGKGKYRNMLGSLLVENEQGITFKLGSGFSDSQRSVPPPIGSIITYKYYGKTKNNVPRFASFMRIRVIK